MFRNRAGQSICCRQHHFAIQRSTQIGTLTVGPIPQIRPDGQLTSPPAETALRARRRGEMLGGMTATDPKDDLRRYLTRSREALLWKLDGLGEYDVRRPLVPTGTNLLGLVKHVGSVAVGYLGETFDRPFPESMPWFDDGAEPNADLFATADETRDEIIAFYHRACRALRRHHRRPAAGRPRPRRLVAAGSPRGHPAPGTHPPDRRDRPARRPRRHRPGTHRRSRRPTRRQQQPA